MVRINGQEGQVNANYESDSSQTAKAAEKQPNTIFFNDVGTVGVIDIEDVNLSYTQNLSDEAFKLHVKIGTYIRKHIGEKWTPEKYDKVNGWMKQFNEIVNQPPKEMISTELVKLPDPRDLSKEAQNLHIKIGTYIRAHTGKELTPDTKVHINNLIDEFNNIAQSNVPHI